MSEDEEKDEILRRLEERAARIKELEEMAARRLETIGRMREEAFVLKEVHRGAIEQLNKGHAEAIKSAVEQVQATAARLAVGAQLEYEERVSERDEALRELVEERERSQILANQLALARGGM